MILIQSKNIQAGIALIAVLSFFSFQDARALEIPVPAKEGEYPSDPVALPPVHLSELIQEAYENNPDIRAAQAEWKAAEKRVLQSWALPDPMIGMDVMGEMTETRVGPQENRMMISQMIPFPWKLWEKRKAAKEAGEVKKQEYVAVRRDILNHLKNEFYDLYAIDASIQTIHEIHGLLKNFESVAQARYANRTVGQRDVAKAQAEVSMTIEQLYKLKQQRETVTARLNVILNRNPFSGYGLAEKPELPKSEKTLIEWMNEAVQNREEIIRMRALSKEAGHLQTLARLENIPDVEIGFTYTWVGSGETLSHEDGKDSWMFPIKINVPLWQQKNIARIQEAGYEKKAAELKSEGTHQKIFYEVKDAFHRFHTASDTVLLYETSIIPQAEIAVNSDKAGYEAGNIDFLNILDSERIFFNARLAEIRIFTEAVKGFADLERASGSYEKEELS